MASTPPRLLKVLAAGCGCRVVTWILRAPSRLYDWRLCRLTHVGRKSGKRYRAVVEVVGRDKAADELLVVYGFGRSTDWYRNLQVNGSAEIGCGFRVFDAEWRELDDDRTASVMMAYERRNRLIAPIVHPVLSAVDGWRYDGSEDACRKLVVEMPILAFTPKS